MVEDEAVLTIAGVVMAPDKLQRKLVLINLNNKYGVFSPFATLTKLNVKYVIVI